MALLGVLKAGAAYVPLDRWFPADRVAHIAADAALRALVTTIEFARGDQRGLSLWRP